MGAVADPGPGDRRRLEGPHDGIGQSDDPHPNETLGGWGQADSHPGGRTHRGGDVRGHCEVLNGGPGAGAALDRDRVGQVAVVGDADKEVAGLAADCA